jgi:drug/metabolite transporter (DMT)-like permease
MDEASALLLAAVVLLETVSHLALKQASMHIGGAGGLGYLRKFIRQPPFALAALCFILTFLSWLAFLSRVPLGQGVMAGSITIVGVMLGGWAVYGERITPARAGAISLIALGVLLVGWGHG